MEFNITGVSRVTMENNGKESTSKHVATDFFLDVSDNLDKKAYLDKDDLPTAIGTKALSQAFIQGLVGNIHNAHENGFWDSADHLRYIIKELERGFATPATPTKGEF